MAIDALGRHAIGTSFGLDRQKDCVIRHLAAGEFVPRREQDQFKNARTLRRSLVASCALTNLTCDASPSFDGTMSLEAAERPPYARVAAA